MTGRNTDEHGRASTPLELLFDLTFVVAFGQAATQFVRLLAEGHVLAAVGGFAIAMFAVSWAWVNFSWFASAFDTDDWFFRVTTMVQMIGVIILALGLPAMFESLASGNGIDNSVMVAGYVVMRIAMVVQWLRAARQDPAKRRIAVAYAVNIAVAQIGWVSLLFIHVPWIIAPAFVLTFVIDSFGPVFAEKKDGGTPWHAHHIVERYGLLTIIALGEGVVGTIASVAAVIQRQGWSAEAILIVVAGTGLTFSLWWVYFSIPSAQVLEAHRRRAFAWGYLHIPMFAAITATGAGLELSADVVEHHGVITSLGAVLTVAVSVLIFLVSLAGTNLYLLRRLDAIYFVLLGIATLVLIAAVGLALVGVSLGVCLIVATLAPVSTVVGFETVGRRYDAGLPSTEHEHSDAGQNGAE
jgi:low temperature requirement protein LtrA